MSDPEVSIVIPCLNEVKTLPIVLAAAKDGFVQAGICGEIIVADNGSTDGSQALAVSLGARVVQVAEKGYGSALRGGIQSAQGAYIIFADADGSYDLSVLDPFLVALHGGADLVMGNRFGNKMEQGAMPWLHRYLGTPVLTTLINMFFGMNITDCNCGMRGLRKASFEKMHILSSGMEFASEMVIKAGLVGLRVREVPLLFHKDKRDRKPHLRTWHDGWRHLRLILIYAPNHLFIYPGGMLFLAGSTLLFMQTGGPVIVGGLYMDLHFMIFGLMQSILGLAIFLMGVTIKQFSNQHDYYLSDLTVGFFERVPFEQKLCFGVFSFLVGFALGGGIVWRWVEEHFANPDMLRGALFTLYFMATGILISLFSLLELVMRTQKSNQQ